MIATKPAVQSLRELRRYIVGKIAKDKRIANHRHRRVLNRITKSFILNPDKFDNEGFNAPTLSS